MGAVGRQALDQLLPLGNQGPRSEAVPPVVMVAMMVLFLAHGYAHLLPYLSVIVTR